MHREYEATIENLPNAAWKLKREYELPEGWEGAVFDWFANNDCSAIESSDDQGGYPSEEQLRAAFDALGYQQWNSCKRKGRRPGNGGPGRRDTDYAAINPQLVTGENPCRN